MERSLDPIRTGAFGSLRRVDKRWSAGRHLRDIAPWATLLAATCWLGACANGGSTAAGADASAPPLDVTPVVAGDGGAGSDVGATCECSIDVDCDGPNGLCLGPPRCVDCLCVAAPADFTACVPDDLCALGGVCAGGVCLGQGVRGCDDGNLCTVDSCTGGACAHLPVDGACDDGNACTGQDRCEAGACTGDPLPGCGCVTDPDCAAWDDDDACTGRVRCMAGACLVDPATVPACPEGPEGTCERWGCEPATGGCVLLPVAEGTSCDDGSPCTTGDTCMGGACKGAAGSCPCDSDGDCQVHQDGDECNGRLGCSEGQCILIAGSVVTCAGVTNNPCGVGTCRPEDGACIAKVLPDGTPCDDGRACTLGTTCQAGSCVSGYAPWCDDGEPCTKDTCDDELGCRHVAVSGPCDDGDACTSGDACADGACLSGAALACDDGNACTADGCDPAVGCTTTPTSGPCDDGNPCTSVDSCADGACVSGPDRCPCQADADCQDLGLDPCKGTLVCKSHVCVEDGSTAPVCSPPPDPCLVAACDPATGGCVTTSAIEGAPCSDGSVCTQLDLCQSGACVGVSPLSCDDGNPCTVDACNPAAGCTYAPIDACGPSCGDGDCTNGETCGSCASDCGACPTGCGDGSCGGGESCADCPQDCGVCPPSCGDGACAPNEDCGSCPADCGVCVGCGDGKCDLGETCADCSADCGICIGCGDGVCAFDETCGGCPTDCGACPALCGDDLCEAPETCKSCPGDCGACAACGDGICAFDETCAGCEADCGPCPGWCGDGACGASESCTTCATDCGPCTGTCGDGACSGGETCGSCPADCGACVTCGDGACAASESCASCPADCGPCVTCGDGVCAPSESCASCPADCGPCGASCGDGACNGGETLLTCHADCAPSWMTKNDAASHGGTFFTQPSACMACHGADLKGGVLSCETCHTGWQSNCTFCHGGLDNATGAPPAAIFGATASSSPKVGAHTVHVTATAKKAAYGCETCHAKPTAALSPGHIDGDLKAEVAPAACGTGSYDSAAGSCNVYCHGSGATGTTTGTMSWTGGATTCDSCHTQAGLTGAHAYHLTMGFKCNTCHAGTVSAAGTIIGPALHVNCTKDVQGITTYDNATKTCGPGCHVSRVWK